ncbi:MAG: BrnT family toxin [Bryobacteraceae bacterium]
MPGAKPPAFDWDDANTAHIARHGVSRAEVEQVILGAALPVASEERGGEERHIELGETIKERLLVVVWTWRGRRIRVVTAYPASRKWRALWKRIKGGSDA